MREVVTQKEFLTFVRQFQQFKATGSADAVVSVVDKNVLDGEFYKAYVHLDKGSQNEIGGFIPGRSEWFVDKGLKGVLDATEKCPKCDRVLKNSIMCKGVKYCLACVGQVAFDAGVSEIG